MPYVMFCLMVANLAFLQMDRPLEAKICAVFAIPLLLARLAREGLGGERLRAILENAPAWKILTGGIGLVLLESLLDSLPLPSTTSMIMRSVMGPISFGTIILAAEIAIHRNGEKNL